MHQKDIRIPERTWNATAASIMLDGIIDDLEIAVEFLEANQAAYRDPRNL